MVERRAKVMLLVSIAFAVSALGGFAFMRAKATTGRNTSAFTQPTAAQQAFDFAMMRHLLDASQSNNSCFSPLGTHVMLSMIYNGASGELRKTLQSSAPIAGRSPEQLNIENAKMLKSLRSVDSAVKLKIVSSVWRDDAFQLKAKFVNDCARYYGAKTQPVDFHTPGAAERINDWVSGQTERMIPAVFADIPSGTYCILATALYFRGDWTVPFDKDKTNTGEFTTNDQHTVPVQFMHGDDQYSCYEEASFQAVELPYGKTGRLGMWVILPSKSSNLCDALQKVSGMTWQALASKVQTRHGHIALPRFTVSCKLDSELRTVLSSLGLSDLFAAQSNLQGMSDSVPMNIGKIVQCTFIQVHEKGSEAASATAGDVAGGTRLDSLDTFTMDVNRPFLFAIRDSLTGAILFMGAIRNPAQQ